MTNGEMDEAIARYLGWGCMTVDGYEFNGVPIQFWIEPTHGQTAPMPRYSADLNAMREAEQRLFTRRHDARDIFIDRLCRIMDPVNGYRKQSAADIIDATAEQHARAFVETIEQIKP